MLSKELDRKLTELQQVGESCAVATVVRIEGSTSAEVGARALVTQSGEIHGWIGGGCAQPAVIKMTQAVISEGKAQLVRVSPDADKVTDIGISSYRSSCKSKGTLDIFIEPIKNAVELLVLGSAPSALALAKLASAINYEVTLAAPQLASVEGVHRIRDSFNVKPQEFQSAPFIVIATQGRGDKMALKAALEFSKSTIGFVASAKKAQAMKEDMRAEGVSETDLDRIHTPFGIDIKTKAPEEIAVSALAKVIDLRSGTNQSTAESSGCCSKKAQTTSIPDPAPATRAAAKSSCCGG